MEFATCHGVGGSGFDQCAGLGFEVEMAFASPLRMLCFVAEPAKRFRFVRWLGLCGLNGFASPRRLMNAQKSPSAEKDREAS